MYRSLYIHVPFCTGGKCDYCAFSSQGHSTSEERAWYLSALEREFARHAAECEPLRSIFIGGGTPSALSADELDRLLSAVRLHFELLPDCEWSCEANPESLTPEKLAVLLEGGVNRLSLGVQSFHEELRTRIGRHGSLSRLSEIVSAARSGGLSRLNFDLIYAIPGETPSEWEEDLREALEYSPDHLSCYSLILEEGTPLSKRLSAPEDDDELFLQCWQKNDDFLGEVGFGRYEISNFAKDGCRCRHNYEVWHGQTYLGCGPAAVSFDGSDRDANPSTLAGWLRGDPPDVDRIPKVARAREILAFGMRTTDGWSWPELRETTGISEAELRAFPETNELLREGLIELGTIGVRPTPKGLLFNDRILEAFLK